MSKSPKGPLIAFAGKVIAQIPCTADGCNKRVLVKVNSGGWPYAICPHCHELRAQSIGAGTRLFNSAGILWIKGMKGPVLEAWNAPPVEPEPVSVDPELEFEEEEAPRNALSIIGAAPPPVDGLRSIADAPPFGGKPKKTRKPVETAFD